MFCYMLLKLYFKKLPFSFDISLSEGVCISSSPYITCHGTMDEYSGVLLILLLENIPSTEGKRAHSKDVLTEAFFSPEYFQFPCLKRTRLIPVTKWSVAFVWNLPLSSFLLMCINEMSRMLSEAHKHISRGPLLLLGLSGKEG